MTEAATPPTAPAPAEADARARARVDKLLAQSPVISEGQADVRFDPVGGRVLRYTATVEFVPVIDAAGEPQAAVMTTAYTERGARAADRPVCFAFNGGPGSASIWLHLGALGPKRIVVPDDGRLPAAPYAVQDNELSWLEHFDLVFIDPPHTGWSTTASEAARKKMLSVDGDVEALAEVVRAWLTRHRRWGSAVYVAGESYGTTRGAALADRLLGAGIAVSGLILVSCAMDLQSICFEPANLLPHALFLPAFANVAQYHGLLRGPLAASPEAARAAAEAFVADDYLRALHLGARLDGRPRRRIARRIAELTGLAPAFVEEKNLRIADHDFFFEAMRPQGRIVGRLDARVTGPMAASRTRDWEFDPGIESIAAPYTMAAMDYFSGALGVTQEARYEVLNQQAHRQWNWNRGEAQGNAFTSTTPDLARALRRHERLKVLVASGRYDLGTPYSASDWSLAQLDVPADVLARITHRYYDAGHMMYTRQADLSKLKTDLAAWLG